MVSLTGYNVKIDLSDMSLDFQYKDTNKAVLAENLCVHFHRPKSQPTSLKEFAIQLVRGQMQVDAIKALDGVSLDINHGEVYGIIGRNGAGKSTLLKVLSRILQPTHGRLRLWGEVTPLLGVGAGFHPDLSGRENVYLYSSLLGRTSDKTDELFDGIVNFAELIEYIDAPIRIYSSGMKARLGFAVAMAERPEILLVDEAMAVGDEQFKNKCKERFEKYRISGTTIVIVSHSMPMIKEFCTRASWLHKGKIMITGETDDVVKQYWKFIRRDK